MGSSNMNSSSTLLKAVTAGRPRQVRLLLDSTGAASAEVADDCGQTPLIRAIFLEHTRNRERIIRLLLKHGALVSNADIVGRNALCWACIYGRDKEVEYLLDHRDPDLDLNQQDINGQTALFHAVTAGSAACVKMLVDAAKIEQLDIEVPNQGGVTPLMQALKQGHDVCASILIHQGGATLGEDAEKYKEFSVIQRNKWAKKCATTEIIAPAAEHSNIQKSPQSDAKSQFPPIIPQSAIQKIQYRENRARASFINPLDSDEDSTYGSEWSSGYGISSNASSSSGSTYTCYGRDTRLTMRTLSFVSQYSSTEANADSDSDEDVDAYSTPIKDTPEESTPRTNHTLSSTQEMHLKNTEHAEHQHHHQCSANFRPKAAKPKSRTMRTNPSDNSNGSSDQSASTDFGDSSTDSEDSGTEDTPVPSVLGTPRGGTSQLNGISPRLKDHQELRKLALRKQVPNKTLHQSPGEKSPPRFSRRPKGKSRPGQVGSLTDDSDSESETARVFTARQKGVLPRIGSKTSLVQ